MVRDGSSSHKIDFVPEGHHNCKIGSQVTMILLNGEITKDLRLQLAIKKDLIIHHNFILKDL